MSFRSSIISQSHSKFWKDQHVWVQLSLPKSFVCLWTPIGEKKQTVVLFSVSSRSNPLCAQDGTGMVWLREAHRTPSSRHLICAAPLRSELSLQPITEDVDDGQGEQFACSEGFSYEEFSNLQPETCLHQSCRRRGDQGGVMMVNMVPLRDAVTFKHTGGVGDNFDVPFVLHLWPSILLRNLLPYPISYKLKVWCIWLSTLQRAEWVCVSVNISFYYLTTSFKLLKKIGFHHSGYFMGWLLIRAFLSFY